MKTMALEINILMLNFQRDLVWLEMHSLSILRCLCCPFWGAGTLSEIALAWQFERPVAVMSDSGGWSERLSGIALITDNHPSMDLKK